MNSLLNVQEVKHLDFKGGLMSSQYLGGRDRKNKFMDSLSYMKLSKYKVRMKGRFRK